MSLTWLQLGWAATPDPNWTDPTEDFIAGGWDAGYDLHSGTSAAVSTTREDCCK